MSKQAIENFKLFSVTPPAALIDNASATTAEIDTQGWDHCRIITYLGATDIALTALAATESDTTGSGHANITGAVFGTSADLDGNTSALPTATDDNKFFVFDIDLIGRKRFLDVTATVGDGTAGGYVTIWAELFRGDAMPTTVAAHGAGGMIKV